MPWGSWPLTPSPIYPPIHSTMLWLKAQMFDGVEVPFKRMLSLYTREMLYLPTQIIAQRNSTGRALNYLSRGYLQVRRSTCCPHSDHCSAQQHRTSAQLSLTRLPTGEMLYRGYLQVIRAPVRFSSSTSFRNSLNKIHLSRHTIY